MHDTFAYNKILLEVAKKIKLYKLKPIKLIFVINIEYHHLFHCYPSGAVGLSFFS